MTHDQTPAEMLDAVNTALDEIGVPTADGSPADRLRAWAWAIQEALDNAGAPASMSGYVDSDGLEVPGTDLDIVGRIKAWADDREGNEWRAQRAGTAAVRKTLLDRLKASRELRLGVAACVAPESAALRKYATTEESAVYLVSDLLPVADDDGGAP